MLSLRGNNQYFKMSVKEPVIKFSPFEALLIGEKNKILKRQPMKNTIFVTRLNQENKPFNLRDLFGLEKITKGENNDVIFKVPQRVCDFLKHKRLQNRNTKLTNNKKKEILCYEFEGCQMIGKSNEIIMSKNKKKKLNSKKVKFKRKFKCNNNIKSKVVKKFPNPCRNKKQQRHKSKTLAPKNKKANPIPNRHLLRGKDGKFICKSEYEKSKLKEISPKQKYLPNYLHQLYLKKSNWSPNKSQLNKHSSSNFKMPYLVETVVEFPKPQSNITVSVTSMLDDVLKKCYESDCLKDFEFPKVPNQLELLDFENDYNLVDIIYENFPKTFKFKSSAQETDFNDALLSSNILKSEKNMKMYEKKKNGFVKDEDVKSIIKRRFPLINLKRISDIMPNHYSVKNDEKMFPTSKIDEPYTRKSHLITGKTFRSFFFKSSEGKDIFIGNLMKPFLQNSWFGSLPEF